MSRKCLMWGSQSLEPLPNFSTTFWLDEGLVLSHQTLEEISTQNGPPKENNKIIVKIIK